MKYSTFLLLAIVAFCGCSQKEARFQPVVDYQGKELSEEEIEQFFEKELANFESLREDTSVVIEEIEDVSQFRNPGESSFALQNMDSYNVKEKLLAAFLNGKINAASFSKILDTLRIELKKGVPFYFTNEYYPQLKDNKDLLDKILAIDAQHGKKEYGFLIKVTQQVPGFEKMIEDSLRNEAFYRKKYTDSGLLLARLAATGNLKTTLELLEIAIDKMRPDSYFQYFSREHLSVFEYVLLNGDAAMKAKMRTLVFKYLNKGPVRAIGDVESVIAEDISPEFKKVIEAKYNSFAAVRGTESGKKEEKGFQSYYLKHYARNFGMSSLEYIGSLLMLPKQVITYSDDDPAHFQINDYEMQATAERALNALEEMVKYNELSRNEKEKIVELLKTANLQNSKSYMWRQYIGILKAMYPDQSYDEFAPLFANLASGYRYIEPVDYWNRKLYSAHDLDKHLRYLAQLGFDTTKVNKTSRFLYLKKYGAYDNEVILWGLFGMLGNSVHYDCETGVWPNPYDELMAQYMNVSPELSDYSVHFTYKKLGEDYDTEYTVAIFNEKSGFITHRRDNSDWYHPNTVEKLLNTALKEQGVNKRFIQVATGDQTVLSIYCNPGQLKLFADKFGLSLMHEQTYQDY